MSVVTSVTQPIVSIQEGQIKGTTGKNLDRDDILQFFGIPYGKPPVDDLRFKPPQPADAWEGVKYATKVGSPSISKDDLTGQIIGSEDCLYLNVYTKNLPCPQSKLRPVMVFIHGGGFSSGSSRPGLYGPEFLMTKDIVLVTFNYRLGILGFLAFDDLTLGVTGNMGLKDQNLALKWVQRNIAYFNGDPNNVTIFGESAGSASAHAHILSEKSKDLFHKAILQSGCALGTGLWGSKNHARKIIKQLGKSADNEKEALEILKSVSGMELFTAQEKIIQLPYPAYQRYFSPVIETPNKDAFIDKSPIKILNERTFNDVPIVMGYNKTEGMVLDIPSLDYDLENFIPYELNVPKGSNNSKEIYTILDELYSKDNHYDQITDSYFLVGILETLRNQLNLSNCPIYVYRMSLEGQLNFLKRLLNRLDEPGVCHADDLGYLFHSDITPEIKPGSLEDKSVRTFVDLWTNFAEYGNPTPNNKLNVLWKPVDDERDIKLLDIGDTIVFKQIPERQRAMAWLNILKKWPLVRFD